MGGRQLCFHTDEGVVVDNCTTSQDQAEGGQRTICVDVILFKYSPDKVRLAVARREGITMLNSRDLSVLKELDLRDIIDLEFSPKGKYLVIQERHHRPVKNPDGTETPYHNIKILDSNTLGIVHSCNMRNPSPNNIKWTEDEKMCIRILKNSITMLSIDDGTSRTINVSNVSDISVSPGCNPKLAVFVMDKLKTTVHRIQTYDIETPKSSPLTSSAVALADRVSFIWSSCGRNLLTLIMTDVDHTGRSYYGDTKLYLSDIYEGTSNQITLDGSVHSVDWNPKKREFAVVYGPMPASTSIYNIKGEKVHDFGKFRYNYAKFNNQGTHLLLAGFGNLLGDIGIWDLNTMNKTASMKASFTSECTWSCDGKYILTSILHKRLKVDNGICVWHQSGVPVKKITFDRLYQATWRPEDVDPESEARSSSPPPIPISGYAHEETSEEKFYRPPSARGITVSLSDTPPPPPPSSYYYSKSKKKHTKDADSTKKQMNETKNGDNGSSDPSLTAHNGVVEIQKKIKNINKRLKNIRLIKERMEEGKTVELNQLESIKREDALREEVERLENELKNNILSE